MSDADETWWVHEHGPGTRARVHRASCWNCNNGRGRGDSPLLNNRWHGLYASEEEATGFRTTTDIRSKLGIGDEDHPAVILSLNGSFTGYSQGSLWEWLRSTDRVDV